MNHRSIDFQVPTKLSKFLFDCKITTEFICWDYFDDNFDNLDKLDNIKISNELEYWGKIVAYFFGVVGSFFYISYEDYIINYIIQNFDSTCGLIIIINAKKIIQKLKTSSMLKLEEINYESLVNQISSRILFIPKDLFPINNYGSRNWHSNKILTVPWSKNIHSLYPTQVKETIETILLLNLFPSSTQFQTKQYLKFIPKDIIFSEIIPLIATFPFGNPTLIV